MRNLGVPELIVFLLLIAVIVGIAALVTVVVKAVWKR